MSTPRSRRARPAPPPASPRTRTGNTPPASGPPPRGGPTRGGPLTAPGPARQTAAQRYHALLEPVDVVRPTVLDGNEHVWHLYVVRVPGDGTPRRRDRVLARLAAAGITAGVHYPTPVHRVPAFAYLGYPAGALPHAEAAANEILSLPLYPHIAADQQEFVVDRLAAALNEA